MGRRILEGWVQLSIMLLGFVFFTAYFVQLILNAYHFSGMRQ